MSGGVPSTGMSDSTLTIKHNGGSSDPTLTMQERLAAKRREQAPTIRPPDDLADLAMRDAITGKVRKVRAGSMRDSILGQAMQAGWLLAVSVVSWLASLRGP